MVGNMLAEQVVAPILVSKGSLAHRKSVATESCELELELIKA